LSTSAATPPIYALSLHDALPISGLALTPDALETELVRLGYRAVAERPQAPGTYRRYRNIIELVTRPFAFWDGTEPGHWYAVTFEDRKSTRLNSSHVKTSYAVFCL